MSSSTPPPMPAAPSATSKGASAQQFHPAWFYLSASVVVIAGGVLSALLYSLLPASRSWGLIFLCVLLYLASLWLLHRWRLMHPYVLFGVALVLLASQLFTQELLAWLPSGFGWFAPWLGLFIGAGWITDHLRGKWATVITLTAPTATGSHCENCGPVTGLVFFLSPPTRVPEFPTLTGISIARGDGQPATNLAGTKLSDDISTLAGRPDEERHNWEQLLRSIQPLQTHLKHLWLVCSSSADASARAKNPGEKTDVAHGSHLYAEHAKAFLIRYLPADTIKFHVPDAVDFQDYNALTSVLDACYRAAGTLGINAGQLAVDITGGIKLASVAGAMLTVNKRTLLQYVPTANAATGAGADQTPKIYRLHRDELIG